MLTPQEIQAIHYSEFIKETQFPNYRKKYHLAVRLLKKKPKAIMQLKSKLKVLEDKYGYALPKLQTLINSTDDLNSIFPLGNAEQTTMIRMLDLRIDLEEFENEIEELVDDNVGGGLGL